jgi:hypothetical protein
MAAFLLKERDSVEYNCCTMRISLTWHKWRITLACLMLLCSGVTKAQNAERMTPKQYSVFLDELDSKLPLLRSHFTMLCARPGWRREDREVINAGNQVFDGCIQLSGQMLSYLSQAVTDERIRPRLSEEFKMDFVLRELIDSAASANASRPEYDSRSGDTDFITKNLAPLSLTLYSHVYASISDDPNCATATDQHR